MIKATKKTNNVQILLRTYRIIIQKHYNTFISPSPTLYIPPTPPHPLRYSWSRGQYDHRWTNIEYCTQTRVITAPLKPQLSQESAGKPPSYPQPQSASFTFQEFQLQYWLNTVCRACSDGEELQPSLEIPIFVIHALKVSICHLISALGMKPYFNFVI